MEFAEVDRQYAELKRQYDAGTLAPDAFDARLRELMIQDGQGMWWAKDRATGTWNYYTGSSWVAANPYGATNQVLPNVQAHPPEPIYVSTTPNVGQMPQATGKPVGKGLAILFYILSFLFSLVGLIIYLVYRKKPFESDRKMANICGILALVSLVLYILANLG